MWIKVCNNVDRPSLMFSVQVLKNLKKLTKSQGILVMWEC